MLPSDSAQFSPLAKLKTLYKNAIRREGVPSTQPFLPAAAPSHNQWLLGSRFLPSVSKACVS